MYETVLTIVLVAVLLFVTYNLFLDIKDYVYVKNVNVMGALLQNKIII